MFFEGYTSFTIAICISLLNLQWNLDLGYSVLYCNVFSILIGGILVGLFIYVPVVYLTNLDRLHESDFR